MRQFRCPKDQGSADQFFGRAGLVGDPATKCGRIDRPSDSLIRCFPISEGIAVRIALCLIAFMAVPALARSEPIVPNFTTTVEWGPESGGNGSYYEIIHAGTGYTWLDAHEYAMTRTHNGVAGHLATLNSCGEERFLAIYLMELPEHPALMRYLFRDRFYCIGGWNSEDYPPDGGPSGWRWITGEPFDFDLWRPAEYPWEHSSEPVLTWRFFNAFTTGLSPAPIDVGVIHNGNIAYAVPCGLIIEYDGLSVVNEPPGAPVTTQQSALGGIKALFR